MRPLIFLSLVLVLGSFCPASGQTGFFCGYNPVNEKDPFKENLCQFFGALPDQEATKVVEAILGKIGVKNSIKIVPCLKIKNCYAWFYNDPKHPGQYILYDPSFLDKVKNSAADWGAKCVLAHEVAHILFGHTFEAQGSNPDFELAADKWSGYALYKLGAPEESILEGIINYAEDKPSITHPPKSKRQEAIIQGYREAQKEYMGTGTSHSSSLNMEKARKIYESAIATPDQHAKLIKLGQAIALNPQYSDAYYTRADVYNSMDSLDAALKNINKAIEYNVDDANYYYLKSDILDVKKERPAAVRAIQTAISLNPTQIRYYVKHAQLRLNNGEHDQCIKICSDILKSDKGSASAYFFRSTSYFAQSQYAAAIDDLSKAISIEPGQFLYYRCRGLNYEKAGNINAALADYRKSLEMKPQDEDSKKLIAAVNKKLEAELTKTRGYVKDTYLDLNITRNKVYGMDINVDFTVHYMKNINGEAVAYFYYEDGTPLAGSRGYETAKHELSSSASFKPAYHPAQFDKLSIFLPYNILVLPPAPGTIRLKYQVCIYSYKDKIPVELCRSEFKPFTLTVTPVE